MTIGLPWMPICFQVIISMISSIVPKPPGNATKASERSNMSCSRSCIDPTTLSSESLWCADSRPSRAFGMTPVTLPPDWMTSSAIAPMRPREAPP